MQSIQDIQNLIEMRANELREEEQRQKIQECIDAEARKYNNLRRHCRRNFKSIIDEFNLLGEKRKILEYRIHKNEIDIQGCNPKRPTRKEKLAKELEKDKADHINVLKELDELVFYRSSAIEECIEDLRIIPFNSLTELEKKFIELNGPDVYSKRVEEQRVAQIRYMESMASIAEINATLYISGHCVDSWRHFENDVETRDAKGQPLSGSMGVNWNCHTDLSIYNHISEKDFKLIIKKICEGIEDIQLNQLYSVYKFATGSETYFWIKKGQKPVYLAKRTSPYYYEKKQDTNWFPHRFKYTIVRPATEADVQKITPHKGALNKTVYRYKLTPQEKYFEEIKARLPPLTAY